MAANANNKDIPNIQLLVVQHKDLISAPEFLKYLDRAKFAYDQFKAAAFTKDIQNRVSTQVSNIRLIDYIWTTLLEDLTQTAEEVSDPNDKQKFLDEIKKIRKDFSQFLPKFRLQSKGLKQDFHEMFPHFEWKGDYVNFYSPRDLALFTETICHELIKTGRKMVKFEIYLPTPSHQEQEQAKNAPRERALPYARKIFEAAAKAGFPPDEVEISIDGKSFDPKQDDLKSEYAVWKTMSFNAMKTKIEKTTGNKLTTKNETEEERSSYKP